MCFLNLMVKHANIHSYKQSIISKGNPKQKKMSKKALLQISSSELNLGADIVDPQTGKLLNIFSGFELL